MTGTKAKLESAPQPLPILQKGKPKMIRNGMTVVLTDLQFQGAFVEAPGLFKFQCPQCRHWYAMLFNLGGKRICAHCIEWRPVKPILKKHQERRRYVAG